MSSLDDLYRQIILDHYKNPRNQGTLPAPAHKVEGFNPLCGDELTLYVAIDDGVVRDIAIESKGCSISQASASLMTTAVKGRSASEVRRLIGAFKHMLAIEDETAQPAPDIAMGDLEALSGVGKFPVRIKCATLAWNALVQALEDPHEATPVTTE